MRRVVLFVFFLFLSLSQGAFAQNAETSDDSKGSTGLPLPRFASLRANEVNMRAGPGTRYPIEWVYTKEGLPVEIIAEYDVWRRISDWKGNKGWVHKSTLSGKRTMIVSGGRHDIHKEPRDDSAVIAHADEDSMGRLLSCKEIWCEVSFDDIDGYMKKDDFWGAYDQETLH